MSKRIRKRGICLDRGLGFEEGRLRLRRKQPKVIQEERRVADGIVQECRIVSLVADELEE
jgi:hypothetical protein